MKGYHFTLAGVDLVAFGSGALFWPEKNLLCVSDLHLGKSDRLMRRGGLILPPYEVKDTLYRLEADVSNLDAQTVVCLGDSFDDLEAAANLREDELSLITRLQAGRRWIWIEGNHDPGPISIGGTHLQNLSIPPLTFRHIPILNESGEVAGHYHPKVQMSLRGRPFAKSCFLVDVDRMILPAYGTYTGGLKTQSPQLTGLMRPNALAILTGKQARPIPMPR